MAFTKKVSPTESFELNSNDQNELKNEINASIFVKNKKKFLIITLAVLFILAGIGVLIGVLLTQKTSSKEKI